MRPTDLNPLFAPLTGLAGVGPRTGKAMEKLAGDKVLDLVWHLPSGIIDRRFAPKLAEAAPGMVATLTLRVGPHRPPRVPRLPYTSFQWTKVHGRCCNKDEQRLSLSRQL